MKKGMTILLSIVVVIAVLLGCVWAYKHFTAKEEIPTNSGDVITDVSKESGEKANDEPIFTNETYPKVDASLAIQPLAEELRKNFIGPTADDVEIEYLNTHYGF